MITCPLDKESPDAAAVRIAYRVMERMPEWNERRLDRLGAALGRKAYQFGQAGSFLMSFWLLAYAAAIGRGDNPEHSKLQFLIRLSHGLTFRAAAYPGYKANRNRPRR